MSDLLLSLILANMDSTLEKDCSALGGLFQAIINDMRRSSPIWEDFTNKATKLNSSLKTTQIAISAFLDTFQKVADMATGSRGATREMGSSLTRLCMRHRSIETKIKTLASTITENLVAPLQEKMEEWKRNVAQMDKDHAKEYKKASQEIKKCAADTIRLQKKVKKGKSDIQSKLENALQDVNDKYLILEETEKNAVRTALIEERSRFCMFVTCFKPFVEWEISLLTEITHLKEVMDNLAKQSSDPHILPPASEQVILDLKGADSNVWTFQTAKNLTPPSSPSSLGSRKSSMCSISSLNSSSDSSTKSYSPTHHHYRFRSPSQVSSSSQPRKKTVTNQDTASIGPDTQENNSNPPTPSENPPSANSTWNNWPNTPNLQNSDMPRPHTISSAYEKTHQRPALTEQMFVPPSSSRDMLDQIVQSNDPSQPHPQASQYGHIRMERPKSAALSGGATSPYSRPTSATINKMQPVLPPLGPKPKSSKAVPPPTVPGGHQPTYVNMTDLAHMAAEKQRKQEQRREERDSKLMSKSQTQSPSEPTKETKEQKSQIQQNSLELAKAIKVLEASTAALKCPTEEPPSSAAATSRTSLQCSSGYGTMNSTPAGSEDTIASGDLDLTPTEGSCDSDKYFTIPRNNSDMVSAYKAEVATKRPASTAGLPVSKPPASGASRRSSGSKPPPPVRRSSSVSTGSVGLPPTMHMLRSSPSKQALPSSPGQQSPQQAQPQQILTQQQIQQQQQQQLLLKQQLQQQQQLLQQQLQSPSGSSPQVQLRHPKTTAPNSLQQVSSQSQHAQQQQPQQQPSPASPMKLPQQDPPMQRSPVTKHTRNTDSPPNPMLLRDTDLGPNSGITGGLGLHYASSRTNSAKVVIDYATPEVSKPIKAPLSAARPPASPSPSVSNTPTPESTRRSSVIDTFSAKGKLERPLSRDGGGEEETDDRGFQLPPPPTEEELAAMGVAPHPQNIPMNTVLSEMKTAQRLRRLSTDNSEC